MDYGTEVLAIRRHPRLMAMPGAEFGNKSDKSSQCAMVIFMSEPRKEKTRNSRGSLPFFESTKIKRTTLSTTLAELDALMKCYGACQMLRSLVKDVTGHSCKIHYTCPWKKRPYTWYRCWGRKCVQDRLQIFHIFVHNGVLQTASLRSQQKPQALIDAVRQGILKEVDAHPPFRSLFEHRAYFRSFSPTVCHHVNSNTWRMKVNFVCSF